MPVPGLHVVTDDEVLADPRFRDRAARLMAAHGPAIAVHLRGPRSSGSRVYELARTLAPVARDAGTLFLMNDRADVALAVDADGVQLGRRSMPVAAARGLGPEWRIGASVHTMEEAADAQAPGPANADFLVLGTIWETASHSGREGAGIALIRQVCQRVRAPVIAIGGVTAERAATARQAGASGVAAVRGIWACDDPAAAAAGYLKAMRQTVGGSG